MCTCGQNSLPYNPCGTCNPTPCTPQDCSCPITDLSTSCVLYTGDDLACSGILSNQILTDVITQLDAFICEVRDELILMFTLVNIGTGAKVFKGIDSLGRKQLRTITKTGDLIVVTENANEIDVTIDEDALEDFVQTNQLTYSVDNIGGGVEIYKDSTIVGDNEQFNLRTIVSDTLEVTEDGDNVRVEQADESGIPQFIVNSDYLGVTELGTEVKPFKNLQNALDAYVGNGVSNKVPENLGTLIRVRKDVNTFVGSLTYAGLNVIIENGATLSSNPTTGTFLCDVDSDATLPTNINYSMLNFSDTDTLDISITVEKGGNIQLQKRFIKNRGNNINLGGANGKIVRFSGDTSGVYKIAEVSVVSPSAESIFSLNEDNQAGFFNDGLENVIVSGTVQGFNSQLAYVGLNSKMSVNDCTLQFGEGATPFNINTIPIKINGGQVVCDNVSINNPTNLVNVVSLETETAVGGTFIASESKLGDNPEYVFANDDTGATTSCVLTLDKCTNTATVGDAFLKSFMASGIWNVRITDCNFNDWKVDDTKIKLIPGSLNTLGGNVVETLAEYASKALAVIGGLFTGCAFVNRKVITTGAFIAGVEYKISNIGNTDFTLIGASANTVGLYFTATGVGGGTTGTADLIIRDIVI